MNILQEITDQVRNDEKIGFGNDEKIGFGNDDKREPSSDDKGLFFSVILSNYSALLSFTQPYSEILRDTQRYSEILSNYSALLSFTQFYSALLSTYSENTQPPSSP